MIKLNKTNDYRIKILNIIRYYSLTAREIKRESSIYYPGNLYLNLRWLRDNKLISINDKFPPKYTITKKGINYLIKNSKT